MIIYHSRIGLQDGDELYVNNRIKVMGKKIYVNGGILVNTRYFAFPAGGEVFCSEQPEGSILIDPTDEYEGSKCLIIDDEHPQSIFNTYYAKTFLTSLYSGAEYYKNNYLDCFNETEGELLEVEKILSAISSVKQGVRDSLMKFLYINVVTILDSFICSIILSTIVRDEILFLNYYQIMIGNRDNTKLDKYLKDDNRGLWEKEIVDIILHTPFENMKNIKKAFGAIGLEKPQDNNGVMSKHFHNRGVLVHRNGKKKEGGRLVVTEEMVRKLLADTENFISAIKNSIPQDKMQ